MKTIIQMLKDKRGFFTLHPKTLDRKYNPRAGIGSPFQIHPNTRDVTPNAGRGRSITDIEKDRKEKPLKESELKESEAGIAEYNRILSLKSRQ
jgi:hypothetical protein